MLRCKIAGPHFNIKLSCVTNATAEDENFPVNSKDPDGVVEVDPKTGIAYTRTRFQFIEEDEFIRE